MIWFGFYLCVFKLFESVCRTYNRYHYQSSDSGEFITGLRRSGLGGFVGVGLRLRFGTYDIVSCENGKSESAEHKYYEYECNKSFHDIFSYSDILSTLISKQIIHDSSRFVKGF